MKTIRLTTAQALIKFLKNQYVERDGYSVKFFAGCFGIFGHGNLAGIGQALQENLDFKYHQARNEQAMVHLAVAYARAKDRMQTFVCTSSVGPGATNMVTGAALASINRLPVLLLPGDTFATRTVAPVLQQLESGQTQDISVNDCFKPVSKYWDRINRPEQLVTAMPEVMRVLTSPSETGAVTLCIPQDVQAEAFEFPEKLFQKRTWRIPRPRPDKQSVKQAIDWLRASTSPLIVAGGGVNYSGANEELSRLSKAFGIPVVETQAGKGSLRFDHDFNLGAIGATGTHAANIIAREADLVIGIGTRYSDFTTASKTAFQNEKVRFININVCEFDAFKHNALALTGDAKATLNELTEELEGATFNFAYGKRIEELKVEWEREADRLFEPGNASPHAAPTQAEVIDRINRATGEDGIVVCAAGSLPGDLHKLWRARHRHSYHVEYGYSCMGYEIAGGLGVKLAKPDANVFVLVGDASYLMMAQELVTAVQEQIKITVILVDNHGYASIGSLSKSLGSAGFGTFYKLRGDDGQLSGDNLPIDFAANAKSMGAVAIKADTRAQFEQALQLAKNDPGPVVIVVETDTTTKVGGYESWWNVPVAEVSEIESVKQARTNYERQRERTVPYYEPPQIEEVSLRVLEEVK